MPDHEAYVRTIQDIEHELEVVKHELALERVKRVSGESLARQRLVYVRTIQTLNLAVFTDLEPKKIYHLACQAVVHDLLWDFAVVVTYQDGVATLGGAYHLTKEQERYLIAHLTSEAFFRTAGGRSHAAISTFGSDDHDSLGLRALFHTDEVIAMPLSFGDLFLGYLVVGAHTKRNLERGSTEELDFLATLASFIAHAVHNSSQLADLEGQNRRLQELDRLKDSFLSITSHQLRTPLSIVKWILATLQGDSAISVLPDQRKLLDQAYAANERLIHVVNDLLSVSRIQEGKLPHHPQPTEFTQMVRELVAPLETGADQQQVSVETHLEDVGTIHVDPLLIKEAVQNLFDNALDYNLPGGYIRVYLAKRGETVVVRVTNTGLTITKEERATLFNQFFRGQKAIQQHPNGNGLGLYLAQAIVRQHGGHIDVESADGVTTFSLVIPVDVPAVEAA